MPIHLCQSTFGSRGSSSWFWPRWLCSHSIEGKALLDHKEFMGPELGWGRILQDLQRPKCMWSGFHGLNCSCSSILILVILIECDNASWICVNILSWSCESIFWFWQNYFRIVSGNCHDHVIYVVRNYACLLFLWCLSIAIATWQLSCMNWKIISINFISLWSICEISV